MVGWDRHAEDPARPSLRRTLPADLRDSPSAVSPPMGFTPLYQCDDEWAAVVHDLAEEARRFAPSALVVSLGVDAAAADPESPLQVTDRGFDRAGRALANVGVPTVFVQEGGYDLQHLGPLVLAVLRGFEA